MAIILDGTDGITTPELDSSGPVAGTTGTFSGAVSGTTGSFSGDFQFNSGYGSVATAYGCRAWVNFNGTGTVAIREDGNVSSITDNGTGDYTINFTTAMPDANFSVVSGNGANAVANTVSNTNNITSASNVNFIHYENGSATDVQQLFLAVFR